MTSRKKKRVRNIAELARIAGVAPSTVSRALSGNGTLSEETRARIVAVATEHDFRPNALAQNLRTQRTGAIGVVVPVGHEETRLLSDPFFMRLIGHLADSVTDRGYDLTLSRVIPKDEDWLDAIIAAHRTDGLIILGQSDQYDVLERHAESYLPMVAWGASVAGQKHCSVGSDNLRGGKLATRHLLSRGCRSIAFVGNPRAIEIEQRLIACRAVLEEEAGKAPLIFAVQLSDDDQNKEFVDYLKARRDPIDGVFASTDVVAMKTLQSIADAGLSVPGDVAVVGYDDLPLAGRTVPPLTTIRQDVARGARLIVERLFDRMAGTISESVVMSPELVVRKSS